ncbi:GNAT family N-acetyltransferase [Phycicoccus sonneratiae]|uniref:N-acetyltransferase n=1 Tax=Phycicoccus sonneratiae TaxID=2807628 RepID=A0ABS2CK01_9MICO|nr:N-acetyltransferase [Phycicoccus sonneraticus]MBM6400125.1 N-acetyltransferase [Phycicoccus sonneraticus]
MRRDLVIRPERPEDVAAVRDLVQVAFAGTEYSDGSVEVAIVDGLRADDDVLPALTFVAELDGEVVGSVVCSRASMGAGESVGLGPLAVRPDHQQQGIGSALVASVVATAEQRAEPSLVLLGDPGYYGAFGFEPAARHGVGSPGPWGEEYFQVLTLRAWRPELAGPFRYAPAFERAEATA